MYYDTNCSSQYFTGNSNMMPPTYGGYPQGYPSCYMQSSMEPVPGVMNNPYIQQQYSMPVPGVTTPLEVTDRNGNTTIIPPSGGQQYCPGGTTVQGGFNPLTGTVTPQTVSQGFNPYIHAQNMAAQGFSPYYPGCPQYTNYYPGYSGYMDNNSFALQDVLYNSAPSLSVMTDQELLEGMNLSDSERERLNSSQNNIIIGRDYYGNPVYANGNAYQTSQQRQELFEQARRNHQLLHTKLSKIAHAYYHEEIDEQSAMDFWDPVRQSPEFNPQKIKDFNNTTEEERQKINERLVVQEIRDLHQYQQRYDLLQEKVAEQKQLMLQKMKDSYNQLLGLQPGQDCSLQYFMENAYKICADIDRREIRQRRRNGTAKYSQNDYKGSLSQISCAPVPITSRDDEYVSIEQTLKSVYDRNRRSSECIMRLPNGQTTFTTEPVFSSEHDRHLHFLQTVQFMKEQNDAKQAGT